MQDYDTDLLKVLLLVFVIFVLPIVAGLYYIHNLQLNEIEGLSCDGLKYAIDYEVGLKSDYIKLEYIKKCL